MACTYMAHTHHHSSTKNIRIAFFLNLGFTVIEFIGGILTNSTAILADAVHDLGDSFALGQAWYFEHLSHKHGDRRYTYGFKRFAMLGALISTLILLTSSFYILSEAIPRIFNPEPSDAEGMIVLAIIGIMVNGYAMLKLIKEKGINARSVGLHLLEDVLGWVAVLIVAIILMFEDIQFLDPALAVLITIYILFNVLKNIRAIIPIFLQAAPDEIDIQEIQQQILTLNKVASLHHAHVWSMDDTHHVFTIHLVCPQNLTDNEYIELKQEVKMILTQYGLYHSTVEIEFPNEVCRIEEHKD